MVVTVADIARSVQRTPPQIAVISNAVTISDRHTDTAVQASTNAGNP